MKNQNHQSGLKYGGDRFRDARLPFDALSERLDDLATLQKGWLGNGLGEIPAREAIVNAGRFIAKKEELSDKFRLYPTGEGGISIEFNNNNWLFEVEMLPSGGIEIDAVSNDGKSFDLQAFDGLTPAFFKKFRDMLARSDDTH